MMGPGCGEVDHFQERDMTAKKNGAKGAAKTNTPNASKTPPAPKNDEAENPSSGGAVDPAANGGGQQAASQPPDDNAEKPKKKRGEKPYSVTSTLRHNGEKYGVGDTVNMTEIEAAELIKCGVLAASADDSAAE
jgi:hypothetical protein